ncbi:hypothetical protein [Flavobacterium sp. B183]|uniref:hypothetical protein n=1 Tax=Flavobacterium sp. B183 TaxID=907046 RepID=UPI00201E965B|nr:hypothetical protein [Flavobacterium sp. B183]URC11899.1 hypothetical protein M4I44_17605 [Flavobacterium sp. B183]
MKNVKELLLTLFLFTFMHTTIHAQNEIIPLWNTIPDEIKATEYKENESFINGKVQSTSLVTVPTLSVFLPKQSNPIKLLFLFFREEDINI